MQPTQTTPPDPSAGVVASGAPWRVVESAPEADFRFSVKFIDGTRGSVEMKTFLSSKLVVGTVFEPLRDPAFFSQMRVTSGAVSWPNGADLAPDAMYDAIREHGVWVVN